VSACLSVGASVLLSDCAQKKAEEEAHEEAPEWLLRKMERADDK